MHSEFRREMELQKKKGFMEKVELELNSVGRVLLCLLKSQTISNVSSNLYEIIGSKYDVQ